MDKRLTSVFLMVLLLSSLAVLGNARASDSFHGIITSSATWTKANSPYTLNGPTAIAKGVTITVEPGVTVNLNGFYLQVNGTLIAQGTSNENIYFTNGQVIFTTASPGGTRFEYTITDSLQTATTLTITKNTFKSLTAGGASIVTDNTIESLTAEGSSTITNNQVTSSCHVGGSAKVTSNNINARLIFDHGCTGTVSNNQISDGIHCDIGGGDVTIKNNQITNTNSYPLIFVAGATATISNNNIFGQNSPESGIRIIGSYHSGIQTTVTITDNQISNCKTGIQLSYCWAEVKRNAIYNNDVGIDINLASSFNIPLPGTTTLYIELNNIAKNQVGIQYESDQLTATISNNNIQDNDYNFKLIGSEDVTVANNWWGTTNTEQIKQNIYDQEYDFNLGKVNTDPVLNSPDAQAPAIQNGIPTSTPTPTPSQNPTNPPQNPTTIPTEVATPTLAPAQSDNQTPANLNTIETAILIVLIIIAILIAALILTIRRR